IGCLPFAHLVLNFRDPAPPSPRGVLANATPKRLPFRLITRNLSSGMWPSFFSSFSKSALNAASASTIASKDFFTSAGKSSASMFCHFNSSRAMLCSKAITQSFKNVVHRPHVWVNSAREANGSGPDRPKSGRKFKPMVPVATCDEPTFSLNAIYGISCPIRGSVRPDAGELDHLGPLFGFVGYELAEIGRRARKYRAAEVGQPRLNLGIGEGCIDPIVELVDDLVRRGLRCADAEPETPFVARHKLTDSRHVG